ncbi:DUF6353 family protein [Bacteroides sp.]|uniref:DUF6353 family protein n=1 Tax=Bacteroides sp. TaxID=29523 RepID=UPI00261DE02B|nr:DUF6353 family protein [Bacteroides sp.]MDD3040036.1 DUF6353 family protein [Bacteroides sp.]
MKKLSLQTIVRNVRTAADERSPEILTGIGIAGMIITVVMTARATPKACQCIDNEKYERAYADGADGFVRDLKPIDYVKVTWRCYLPAAITGTLSIACLIGGSSVNHKRNAALATAYTLSETALKEYKNKVVETIGEKKEQSVRDAIAKDKLVRNPVKSNEVVITGKGETLCYDSISGRYFKSDIDKIKKALNELNKQMLEEMYVSLNDFYYAIGLKSTSLGDDLGWNIDRGLLELDFSAQLMENGEPCLAIDYRIQPKHNFSLA